MNADNQTPIVYSHVFPWEMPWNRQQYIAQALSAHTHVVYLNYHPSAEGRLVVASAPRIERITDSLTVIHHPRDFRFSRVGSKIAPFIGSVDVLPLHALLRRIGITDYIYWLAAAFPPLVWGMNTRRLVYDCMDPLFDESKRAAYDHDEFAIARRARLVFASAHSLIERMQRINPATYSLPNACAATDIGAPPADMPLPALLHGRPRPIIGYVGAFDGRVDVDTLVGAAQQLPDYTFALVGRVNLDQTERIAPLRALPNVIMPGLVPTQEGTTYMAAFDVALIPFLPGPTNDSLNPVKLHMYLAKGKPIVSTWLRESYSNPLVATTRTIDEFVTAIRAAIATNDASKVAARLAFAHANTWDIRARTALDALHRHGLLTAAVPPLPAEIAQHSPV